MTSFNLRKTSLWIHRYTGLAIAGFLIIASITGTLLAFHDELDDVFDGLCYGHDLPRFSGADCGSTE